MGGFKQRTCCARQRRTTVRFGWLKLECNAFALEQSTCLKLAVNSGGELCRCGRQTPADGELVAHCIREALAVVRPCRAGDAGRQSRLLRLLTQAGVPHDTI